MACGKNHTLALSQDGNRLFAWGDGECGKLGLGSTTSKNIPNFVESLRNVGLKKIDCGSRFSMAVGNNGALYIWGFSKYCDITRCNFLALDFISDLFMRFAVGESSILA